PVAAPAAPPAQVAAVDPAKAPTIGRTELLGGWRVASGPDNCQIFMNLTSWAGGYRAISKGCSSPDLQKISAWDLQGKTVTLKGSDGATVATLVGAGGERFTGRPSSSQSITLSR
ncbi:MAG: AprI/Inh family metalloprotease inhibitor, partial [Phyllobacteriaceae bacterium]|nr:AprI/Inh family metalloprotease inhibitor [Phyllobacteriaceae bacterium]